ncbi:hypothetical protein FACS18942_05150 [Planctomycetales bacterium]|nr:hypothetical protein FACS18942_05150 [Planctomycetales bacterium]
MTLLVFLIFPYYYNIFLSICFARKERAKFHSLVGKEGMSVRFERQYNMVVEIDNEEFDAIPYSNGTMVVGIKTGIPVIVLRANAVSIDVEEKIKGS